MSFAASILVLGIEWVGAQVSWDRVGELFSHVGAVREEAHRAIEEENLVAETGEKLPRIAGHNAFWFGWYAFFPTTEIYER